MKPSLKKDFYLTRLQNGLKQHNKLNYRRVLNSPIVWRENKSMSIIWLLTAISREIRLLDIIPTFQMLLTTKLWKIITCKLLTIQPTIYLLEKLMMLKLHSTTLWFSNLWLMIPWRKPSMILSFTNMWLEAKLIILIMWETQKKELLLMTSIISNTQLMLIIIIPMF